MTVTVIYIDRMFMIYFLLEKDRYRNEIVNMSVSIHMFAYVCIIVT